MPSQSKERRRPRIRCDGCGKRNSIMPGLLCPSCSAEQRRKLDAANAEVDRQAYCYTITPRLYRLIRDAVMEGLIPDASLAAVRSRAPQWWLGLRGVGEVTVEEMARLLR